MRKYRIDQESCRSSWPGRFGSSSSCPSRRTEAAADGYGDGLDDSEREAGLACGRDRDVHRAGDRGRAGAVHRRGGRPRARSERRRGDDDYGDQRATAIEDARAPLWFGRRPAGWGDVVRGVNPDDAQRAAAMIAAAGLDWRSSSTRSRRSSSASTSRAAAGAARTSRTSAATRARCSAWSATGTSRCRTAAAFAFCDAITDSGQAHWIGAGATRGGARVHALMRLDREIRIGGRGGRGRAPAALLPQRPRRRPRGHGLGRAVPARVPERDAAPARRRASAPGRRATRRTSRRSSRTRGARSGSPGATTTSWSSSAGG